MRCHEALEAMLTCEPEVLRGEGGDEMSMHVRSCARCAAVGAKVARVTSLVDATDPRTAGVTPSGEQRAQQAIRARRVRVWTAVALPIAATVLAVMMRRGAIEVVPATVPVPASSVASAPITPIIVPAAAPSEPSSPLSSRADVVEVDGAGIDTEPALHAPPPADPIPTSVQVHLTAGQSAAILSTSDPKVTVVWLYSK